MRPGATRGASVAAPVGEVVAEIWTRLLGAPPSAPDEDFFKAGGDSVAIARAAAILGDRFGVRLSLSAVLEEPTPAGLTAALQRALATQVDPDPALEGLGARARARCSHAQERFWFLHQTAANPAVHNISWPLRVRGSLDEAALRKALEKVVARHDTLRTRFALEEGQPVQVIVPEQEIPLELVDLSGEPQTEREARTQRLVAEVAEAPFDLERGPLVRARLLRLAEQEHVLALVFHHIAFDDWSMGILFRELSLFYDAPDEERPDVTVQYPEFAEWQRSRLTEELLERELEHWRQRLEGLPSALELPIDRPRPAVPSLAGGRHRVPLPARLVETVGELGRCEGASFFMTMLAVFDVLLHRYTGQDDFVVGTAVDNRGRPELEGVIGLFTNPLVIRTDLSGGPTFRELLARVRERTLEAVAHQELPFNRLAAELPDREAGRHPVFQAFFEFMRPGPMPLELAGLELELFELPRSTSEFDLTLYLDERLGALDALWEYSADLFDQETVERMGAHFVALLEAVAANPDAPVAELPLVGEEERRALARWNETETEYPAACVQQLFEEQAARTPDLTAVVAGGRELTYRELNESANRVAHLLRERGVCVGDAIGLCLDRSAELVVGLLGILKADAAYVPLNPEHPPARLARQLTDAGAKAVVTLDALGAPDGFEGAVLRLDAEAEDLARQPPQDPEHGSTPDDDVYVLYTSGSTGAPKGVAVRHRNLVNYVTHIVRTLGGRQEIEGLRFATVSAISTDLGNTTVFPSLLAGGCLHVVERDTAMEGSLFAEYVEAHPLDVLKITPSHLRSLLDAAAGRTILPRHWLIVGGEAFPWDLAERVSAPGRRVLNHYGPTETTVGSCTYEVVAGDERPAGATVPIGKPIANTKVHILDRNGSPAPIGVPGELFIGGDGVSRGYVSQPEQTAERFVPDPFAVDSCLYRTGDVARFLPDGNIEFLGRADEQVKIRGYRVEPAEVESALLQHPSVRQAVVVARGEGETRHLAGYVLPQDAPVPGAELRSFLEETLPPYMVPATLVWLDELPLTPSGKVDRLALPEAPPAVDADVQAPRTETERTIAAIWSELLEREDVGVEDNFFELGGHSLLTVRLIARLRADLDISVPLRAFVEEPTVAFLAARVDAARAEASVEVAEPKPADGSAIVRGERAGPLACSFAQEQFWLVDQLTPGSPAYNFSWPLRLRGELDVETLRRAFDETVRRHEALRTRLVVEDGRPVQIVDPPGESAFEVVDLSQQPEPDLAAQRLVDEETRRPFDLAHGPLLRVRLLHLGAAEHILQIVVHHAVFDGWSKVVLFRELGQLYAAFSSGRRSPLPEPPVQYADFSDWQRSRLREEVLEQELEHWARELEGVPANLELPSDRPRPPVATLRGARRRSRLPAELTKALEQISRAQGVTFFTALLALFDVLLYRYTGQEDVVVGIPVDNRDRPEIQDTVGAFLNTVVVRGDLSGSPSFAELLGRVHRRVLDAVEHQDLPFERLVQRLRPERDLSRHPIYQVLLAINPPEPRLELPGVESSDVETEWAAARVDLFLVVEEQPDGFDAVWEYSTDLFDDESIERMQSHFLRLLEAVVADPELPVDRLPLIGDEERRLLLEDWNNTTAELAPACVHELVAAQAATTPDRTAVRGADGELTYAELAARANRLAHHLRELGVESGSTVGICLERSAEMVVALLAVLECGAAYVPIDPAYPTARQRFMLESSDAIALVTEERLLERLPRHHAQAVCLDRDREAIAARPADPLGTEVDPEQLAYVMYTSGSTGEPKGVEIPHRALSNFLASMRARPGLTSDDVLVAVTTLSFDIAGLELYLPLVTGALLVVATQEETGDPRLLRALLERSATVMQATPATWRMLVDDGWPGKPGLKALCGGEAFPAALADELLDRGLELWNMYGPTETTIWSTVERVTRRGAAPSLGRPIANTSLYVLDPLLQPVPVGVPGELYIGGAGMARGYRGRPDLTAERFVAHPFDPRAEARLYRTGDLVRYRGDGSVEFLGRLDHQVKVRGFRIELGEVERQLERHAAVGAAVAATCSTPSGDRLVAYVVPEREPVAAGELRAFLEQSLPAYMVPSTIVTLDALPLTPNGKVDRRALPAPDDGEVDSEAVPVEPRTELEEQVAGVWAELLGREQVGVEDDFFELGGHSLLAARAVGRLQAALDIDLPLRFLFEAPTVAGLAARIEESRGQAPATAVQPPPLVPAARVRRASFAQERFWFVDQVAEQSEVYNIAWPLRLRGPLSVPALERALGEVLRRHEVLRTRFAIEEGHPVQVVDPPAPVRLEVRDLASEPEPERWELAKRLVDEDVQTPFDLEWGPVVRARLLRLADQDHVLQIVVHHVAADGWSKVVFFRELGALYGAFAADRPSPLADLPIQYGDYAEWQRSWVQGELLERELEYWTEALAGAPTALELPADRPRPAVASSRGAWLRAVIPAELADEVGALARREGATLFMALLAGLDALLHRYTGQEDVVVGTPVDARNRPELEHSIGPFINTVPLRVDMSGNPSYRELLQRVRGRTLDALSHQDLPFDRMVQELQSERDHGRHPVFQVLLAVNPPEPPIELPGLAVEELGTEKTAARFDLALMLRTRPEGLEAVWEYSTDLFERATIAHLQEHLVRLLEAALSDLDRPVAELPLLSEDERRQVLHEWNDTAVEYPGGDQVLHELVEAQVERDPEAVAVGFEGEGLSYRELNARANRLARSLRELGVGPESIVAVCVERSPELVIALLATLKAGGAYLPLDPGYPNERLAFMLEDSGARVLLTQQALLDRLPLYAGAVRCIDGFVGEGDDANLGVAVAADNAAYVIYTSGSTGTPKGVVNEHRGIVNRLLWMQDAYRLDGSDRVLQKTPFSFDVSVWEFFWPLITGARLVVARPGGHQESDYLVDVIEREGITTMHFVPSMLHAFLGAEGLERCSSLWRVFCSGEALPAQLVERFFERFDCDLHNLYGPTEAAVDVTYWQCRPGLRGASVPIGCPVANTSIYVLDARLDPVPVGVVGELYIGGVQVARGYLGRPELTAERFVDNPFAAGRLYRTGDLARWTADGVLEFLGRVDDQVKIRGFRVELGEIEAALTGHPAVSSCAVVALEARPGDLRLAAYAVPALGSRADSGLPGELRAFLRERLPDFMLPSSFMLLEELPLSPNGKLDRRRLPAPAVRGSAGDSPPLSALEREVADIWQELLGVEAVGPADSFFELGGHSLLLAQVAARLRERHGVDVSLRTMFERPTVAALAAHLDEQLRLAGNGGPSETAEPIPARSDRQRFPLSQSQQGLWLMQRWNPEAPTYNMALSFRLHGTLDEAALHAALEALVARHEVLRSVVREENDEPFCALLEDWELQLPLVDLTTLPPAEREREAERRQAEEVARPFDLSSDLMLRATLIRLVDDDHVLVLCTHHVAFDGWSEPILLRELSELYAARREGRPCRLAEPALQYGDFAVWQRQRLSGGRLETELAWWREQLTGTAALVDRLADRPRTPGESLGETHRFELPSEVADLVRASSRDERATPYIVLLAAFAALLYRRTGVDDVAVGSPMANRGRPELEDLVGFCSNTIVLRTRLVGNPTFRELVSGVREVALDAFAHQEVPFEKVVEAVRPQREVGGNPLFQVNFRVVTTAPAQLELAGLRVERRKVEVGLTRFDLALELHPREDGIGGYFRYDRRLFDPPTIVGLAGDLAGLLDAVLRTPDRRLLDLESPAGAPTVNGGALVASESIRGFRRQRKLGSAPGRGV